MVHATWGDWFIAAVEDTAPSRLTAWYLGCNGFIITSETTTLFIDPYFGDGNPPKNIRMIPVPMDPADATRCDAVLVTHEHIDHMHPPSIRPLIENLDATLYAPETALVDPDFGDPPSFTDTVPVTPGDDLDVNDVSVHVRKANDPDAREPVSFVIDHESATFFHGGDSRPVTAFETIGRRFDIDAGALALGSKGHVFDPSVGDPTEVEWYNGEGQLVTAAQQLQLPCLLPSHYDMWRGLGADPTGIPAHAHSYAYPETVIPIQIGDQIDIGGRRRIPWQ